MNGRDGGCVGACAAIARGTCVALHLWGVSLGAQPTVATPPTVTGAATTCPADVRVPSDQCTRHTDVAFSPDAPARGVYPTLRLIADVSRTGGTAAAALVPRMLLTAGGIARVRLPWGWPDLTMRLATQWRPGRSATAVVGDLQSLSNIDAPPFARVSDAWIEMPVAGPWLRTKVGHFDLNQDYAFAEAAAPFSHSAFSFSQNIVALPTYPRPASGVHVFATPRRGVYVKAGIADGGGAFGRAPTPSPPWALRAADARFAVAEAGVDNSPTTKDRVARLAIGGWRHDGVWPTLDGGSRRGTGGVYGIAEGTVWDASRGQDDRAFVSGFAMASAADRAVSAQWVHLGVGLTAFGLVRSRPDDVLGVAVSRMRLSPAAGLSGAAETAIEAVWRVAFPQRLTVAPTLTLVANPGGVAPGRWASVLTVRVVWHSPHG